MLHFGKEYATTVVSVECRKCLLLLHREDTCRGQPFGF
jgi:hypothetical protein